MHVKALYDEFKKAVAEIENPFPEKVILEGPIVFGDDDAIGFIINFRGPEGDVLKEGTIHWRVEDGPAGSLIITDAVGYTETIAKASSKSEALRMITEQWKFYLNEALILE